MASALEVAIWGYQRGRTITASMVEKHYGVSRDRSTEIIRQIKRGTRYQVEIHRMPPGHRDATSILVTAVQIGAGSPEEKDLVKAARAPRPIYSKAWALALGIKQRET